jgi:uncharacterized Zn-finger protein
MILTMSNTTLLLLRLLINMLSYQNTVPEDKTKHAQESYTCDRCNKTFARRTFRQHWHTHEKHMYSCRTCNKSFYDKSNFKKHNRTHAGDRPFSCVVCNKSFSDPTGLKQHNRNHSCVRLAASSIQRMKCKKNQHLEA